MDSNQHIREKYHSFDTSTKKRISREVSDIRECGANTFFIETGCQANDAGSYWLLVAYAMEGLGLITTKEYEAL